MHEGKHNCEAPLTMQKATLPIQTIIVYDKVQ